MAYVNVKDWNVDQVTDWLKGLDNVILQYTTSFLNNGVTGHQLLNLRADDLEHLGVVTLGHQEIILEAVEHLRHFHFELDKENLQMLALRLSCAANSLFKELCLVNDSEVVQKQSMADVHNIITTIKPLACWLDRSPFAGDADYNENKTQLLQLGFEMATSAHRGIFSEQPVKTIRKICEKLVKIADHIIQEIADPMILQPASLDLATLKKKEQELGFFILPNNHAVHQIAEIKYGSPAHGCTKIEEGDEIVQVNYQTVVGWQRKKVMMLLQESPPEIVLTLKKRPRHTKVYGQIYMKPYRLPSRKRGDQPYSRWNDNLPSPRLLPLLDLPPIQIPKSTCVPEPPDEIEMEEISSSDSEPPDSPLDGSVRMYPLKPRPLLQRRNTITGTTPTDKRPHLSVAQYWHLMNLQENSTHSSSVNIGNPKFDEDPLFMRDKSASCSLGLEKTTRPTTVIGLSQSKSSKKTPSFKNDIGDRSSNKKRVNFNDKPDNLGSEDKDVKEFGLKSKQFLEPSNLDEEKSVSVNSLASLTNENIGFIDEGRDLTDRSSMVTDWKKEIVDELIDTIKMKPNAPPEPPKEEPEITETPANTVIKDYVLAEVNIHNIIKKFDNQSQEETSKTVTAKPKVFPRQQLKKPPEVPQKPDPIKRSAIPPQVPPRSATTKLRGRLDKSHSTPAYDLTGEDDSPVQRFCKEKHKIDVPVPPGRPTVVPSEKPIVVSSSATFPEKPSIIVTVTENAVAAAADIPAAVPPKKAVVETLEKPAVVPPENSIATLPEKCAETQPEQHMEALQVKAAALTPERPVEPASELGNDPEAFIETNYEFGLPVAEASNTSLIQSFTTNLSNSSSSLNLSSKLGSSKTEETKIEELIDDVPPKPPPRTFGVVELPKPAYPSDSPKPANLVELAKSSQIESTCSRQIFQFPDNKSSGDYLKGPTVLPPKPDMYRSESMDHSQTGDLCSLPLIKTTELFPIKHVSSEESLKTPKLFEPKTVSTPIRTKDNDLESVSYKSPNYEMQKSTSDSKVSPTNSIVRAMIYSNKHKAGKKKNNLMSRRRKVTVSELSPADLQGYLYQRLRNKQTQQFHWEKRWFVLLGNCLYGFKTKEHPKASFLVFLSGFTVAIATEVNSRANAFKVYHTGTVFYFSAEDSESLQSWIEMITPATLHNDGSKINDCSLYSDTDESDTEKPKAITPEKTTESLRKCGSLKKFTSKKNSDTAPSGSTSLDRKWFFNKSSSQSKNSLPVPTAQFRSYRKIRTSDECTSVTTGNFTSHVPSFAPRSEIKKLSHSQNISVPNLTVTEHISSSQESVKVTKLSKTKPLDYVHASNPSLCNVTDFNLPAVTIKKLPKQHNESLAGFVTLEELMNRQAEERKLNPHFDVAPNINFSLIKPDVVYGEVPIRSIKDKDKSEKDEKSESSHGCKKGHSRSGSDSQKLSDKRDSGSSCFGKRLGSLKKCHREDDEFENKTATYPKVARGFDNKLNRSLPRTHKLQSSNKHNSRSSSQKLYDESSSAFKKHSYEMIYCPQTVTDVQFAQNRNLDDRMYNDTPKKSNKLKKQHSFNSNDKKSGKSVFSQNSKVSDSSASKVRLKSATQYTPMSLPLSQDPKVKPKFAFELNLDEKPSKGSGGKLKQIFGKQSEPKKEKTFLGSPKLHRAIFKRNNSGSDISWPSSPIQTLPLSQSTYSLETHTPVSTSEPVSLGIGPHVDYPGLEYPPVFEPETYSLADPQSSLSLIRKQGKASQSQEKK